ncbi:hypothetical protein PICMEDRAFT_154025 [Pichia membranifaciens NRRL Y-2026]|uniref:Uncharacterized protein n=1 Tax=Pichia membranifaciens NRRL Y-2026 TaxID=763406 RepID=A0A1E3NJ46_9ASCO|nr:hypothetical protein PICMEDRAFT_154025 [Pichia membranifaciens NRRL Y-2026]ODQ46165.1 hypothetical protein PICMEDRAFT_154025 [Pichia membranifaciens NRRL Y-2026]
MEEPAGGRPAPTGAGSIKGTSARVQTWSGSFFASGSTPDTERPDTAPPTHTPPPHTHTMACKCTQKAMEMTKAKESSCCSSKTQQTAAVSKSSKSSCCSGKAAGDNKPSRCCCGSGCGCPGCNTTKL